MSRLLPCLALAQASGIVCADRMGAGCAAAFAPLAAAILLAGPVALPSPRARAWLAIAGFFVLGLGSLGTRLEQAASDRVWRSRDLIVDATICGQRERSTAVEVDLCGMVAAAPGVTSPPRRALLHEPRETATAAWLMELARGDRVRVRVRLRPVAGLRNPGGSDAERRLARRGLGARATLVQPSPGLELHWSREERRAFRMVGPLVRSVRARLFEALAPHDTTGLLSALSLGDRRLLSVELRSDFRRLGLAHLLAVSGLHLGLVAGLALRAAGAAIARMEPVARRTDARLVALLAAAVATTGYALLCGFGISVQRSLVCVWCVVLGCSFGRRMSGIHCLSLAAIVILTVDPAALFEVGAQLSFAATAAIVLGGWPRHDSVVWLGGCGWPAPVRVLVAAGRRASPLLHTSGLAVAATSPLLAWHGSVAGGAALVCNLVAVPWTGLVLLPAALVALPASLVAQALDSDAWVAPVALIAEVSVELVSRAAARWPEPSALGAPAPWVLLLAGVCAFATVRSSRLVGRLALALLTVSLLRAGPRAEIEPQPPRVVALDVGQGDAVVVQGPAAAVLIDGGGAGGGYDMGARAVLPALRALGIARLDLVVASHADLDHRGGLVAVLEGLPVEELWLPRGSINEEGFSRLLAAARGSEVRVREVGSRSEAARLGDLRVVPLWPPPADSSADSLSRNDRSLVVRIDLVEEPRSSAARMRRVLLMGDAGEAAERVLLASAASLAADVLKVGHHGSTTSSGQDFLAAVDASVAIVSASCGSRTGLPSRSVLSRLRDAGAEVGWTGRVGAVIVPLGGPGAPVGVPHGWGRPRACLEPLPGRAPAATGAGVRDHVRFPHPSKAGKTLSKSASRH